MPDIITMAKGIAGGLPLSAITGRADLLDAVHPGGLGGTYGGNPVACAAALVAIETMKVYDLPGRAAHRRAGDRQTARSGATTSVDRRRPRSGAMIAVELVRPGTTTPDPALAKAVAARALAQGVVLPTCGTYGNVMCGCCRHW